MLIQEQQIFEQIKKAKHILITFNKIWNGDAVASALAIYLFLKKLDKDADIAAEKFDQGKLYSFLPAYQEIKHQLDNLREFIISLDITNAKVGQIKYTVAENSLNFIISPKEGFFTHDDVKSRSSGFKYDLIITLDTPDLESLGSIYDNDTEFFYQIPIINIDHHSDNEGFGQINQVELTSIATAEILFNLFTGYSRDLIDENIATCLLAGIISKTRSFKTQNITPQALAASSQLISMGARREEIVNQLYRSRSLNVLKLWGRVLARLTSDLENKLVWSVLADIDFSKTNTGENDLNEVIDELIINIPQAKIVVLIYETKKLIKSPAVEKELLSAPTEEAETKALIYSIRNINSLDLVKKYNPVGTRNLAKIKVAKGIEEAEKEIIESIKEDLSKLPI
jgi:nanoRNase/pAp phosphatase (c-di-AMP/oligoRNAs hydrolase)